MAACVFTDDEALAEKMKSLRIHGKGSHKYDNARIGINGRLDSIQAAVLLAKFDIFPEEGFSPPESCTTLHWFAFSFEP